MMSFCVSVTDDIVECDEEGCCIPVVMDILSYLMVLIDTVHNDSINNACMVYCDWDYSCLKAPSPLLSLVAIF